MKSIVLIFLILLSSLYGDKLVVAANIHFIKDGLSAEDVRNLYTAREFRIANEKVIPLNLAIDHPLRTQFEKTVLGQDRKELSAIWLQAHYLGHHPPKVFKSKEAAAEFLMNVDNAIGYMDEETALKYGLKILYSELSR